MDSPERRPISPSSVTLLKCFCRFISFVALFEDAVVVVVVVGQRSIQAYSPFTQISIPYSFLLV